MTASPEALPLKIDIVSDVVCPWCIVGFRQLSKALEALPNLFTPTYHWHPFELNPQMPAQGQELREHMRQKYGPSAGGGSGGRQRLLDLGHNLGFEFDYFEGMKMVNTFAAHQLLHWAAEQNLQTELKLALFSAFFQRREDVSDLELLVDVASRVGLDSAEAAVVLEGGRYAQIVRDA
ncbi:MAG: DsbA family oxidoreductase, partial [Halioglobus sp.]